MNVITKNTPRTFGVLLIGYVLTLFPLFLAIITSSPEEANYLQTAIPIPERRPIIDSEFAISHVDYLYVIQVEKYIFEYALHEGLMCCIALGLSIGIAWWDTVSDDLTIGFWGGFYSWGGVFFSVISVLLFGTINYVKNANGVLPEKYDTLVSLPYHVLFFVSFCYFLGFLQLRRRKDIIAQNA